MLLQLHHHTKDSIVISDNLAGMSVIPPAGACVNENKNALFQRWRAKASSQRGSVNRLTYGEITGRASSVFVERFQSVYSSW